VVAFDKETLLDEEINYYEHGTALGTMFRFGLGGAVVIGVVILYQILYQIISKHMRDYATLKAIGFSQGMLHLIVIRAAMLLAFLGFVPGFIASLFMYQTLTASTSLRFAMTADKAIVVLVMVCLICLVAALFAIRRLRDADPADLFG
jgi:putative ABC transport system permease protein